LREPREGMKDFITRKREIFMVGKLIQEKELEIEKMHRTCEKEEQKLKYLYDFLFLFMIFKSREFESLEISKQEVSCFGRRCHFFIISTKLLFSNLI
jgi:hypothetical protein